MIKFDADMAQFGMAARKDGIAFNPKHRQEKRAFREMGMVNAVQDAYYVGEYEASRRHPRRNPFPPGARHDAFENGFKTADPVGDHHGRNY